MLVDTSRGLRLFVIVVISFFILNSLVACSKGDKKGTPVSDRNTGAPGGIESDPPVKTTDGSTTEGSTAEGTAAPEGDVHQRGYDQNTQLEDSSGTVTGGGVEQLPEVSHAAQGLGTTPVDQIGVSSQYTPVTQDSGDYRFGSINRTEIPLHYDWLRVVAPDYSQVHVRANDRPYTPIITLGTDPAGEFDFTDYEDDLALNTVLQLSMRQDQELSESQFVEQSKDFARDIRNIRAQVAPYYVGGRGYSIATVKVTYMYESQLRTLDLYGYIDVNGQASMGMLVPVGETAQHKFQGYLTCLDQAGVSNGCQNSILVIEQVKAGTICKRVFAVIRNSNVAFTIGRSDYMNYLTESNPQKRAFINYLSNTILADRINDGIIVPEEDDVFRLFGYQDQDFYQDGNGLRLAKMPMPYMSQITARTYAVAHGYAETEILLKESNYRTLEPYHVKNPRLVDNRKDVLRIVGPMSKQRAGANVTALAEVDGYIQDENEAWVKAFNNEPLMSSNISSAEIVGNDGRGFIEVKFNFGKDKMIVNFTADNVPTKDPRTIRRLYPYQGQMAPQNLDEDRLPVHF
jgi:hypothetical protein